MANYGYWKQYGFDPEYAEAFEKLGIRSINALRERAPELEEKYGLDGLCEVVGVPNTIAEAREKAREQEYRSQMRKGSSDVYKKNMRESKSLLGIFVIGFVLLILIGIAGSRLGLLKAPFSIQFQLEENSLLIPEKMSVSLLPKDGKKEPLTAQVDGDGFVKLDVPRGEYEVYLHYEDMCFLYGSWATKGIEGARKELKADGLINRAVLVRFLQEDGAVVMPDSMKLTDENDEKWNCNPVADGWYVVFVPNDITDVTMIVEVDDYPKVTVRENISNYRLAELEVVLK